MFKSLITASCLLVASISQAQTAFTSCKTNGSELTVSQKTDGTFEISNGSNIAGAQVTQDLPAASFDAEALKGILAVGAPGVDVASITTLNMIVAQPPAPSLTIFELKDASGNIVSKTLGDVMGALASERCN